MHLCVRLERAKRVMASAEEKLAMRKREVAKMLEKNDRFEILKELLPRVPIGTIWFSDTANVGPANIDKCKVPMTAWIDAMKACPDDGRCKGRFLTSFGRVHATRRCERVASAKLCRICLAMFTVAKMEKNECISVKGQNEYEIKAKTMFASKTGNFGMYCILEQSK